MKIYKYLFCGSLLCYSCGNNKPKGENDAKVAFIEGLKDVLHKDIDSELSSIEKTLGRFSQQIDGGNGKGKGWGTRFGIT